MNLKTIPASCFLVATLTLSAAPARPEPTRDILKDLQATANDAADQAAELQSSTFSSSTSWEVHALKLQALKDDVNEISRVLTRLEGMRDGLDPADREVIDHSMVLLKEMVANTQGAVQYLNEDQRNLWAPAYRKYIDNVVNETDQLAHSLGHVIALDKTRNREKSLEKSLEMEK